MVAVSKEIFGIWIFPFKITSLQQKNIYKLKEGKQIGKS